MTADRRRPQADERGRVPVGRPERRAGEGEDAVGAAGRGGRRQPVGRRAPGGGPADEVVPGEVRGRRLRRGGPGQRATVRTAAAARRARGEFRRVTGTTPGETG